MTKTAFSETGLPHHPTLHGAYYLMLRKTAEQYADPAQAREAEEKDVALARALFEQGWTSDPDLLAAALLKRSFANGPREDYRYERQTNPRAVALLKEIADFAPGFSALPAKGGTEALVFAQAATLRLLEEINAHYAGWRKEDFARAAGNPADDERLETHRTCRAHAAQILAAPPVADAPGRALPGLRDALARGNAVAAVADSDDDDATPRRKNGGFRP